MNKNEDTKSNRLTPKQEAFCRYYAIEKQTQRQAYISAYGRGKRTDKTIDEHASRLVKNDKVMARLNELRDNLAEKVLWSKADMINDLREIAAECKKAGMLVNDDVVKVVNPQARNVAINAIKTAGEFLGYKQADKVEASGVIEIIIKGGDERYGG